MVFASGIGFHGAALPCGPSGPVGNLLQCGPRRRDGLRALDGAVGWHTARALMHVFPAPLLAVSGQWFTDLGLRSFIPWQEAAAVICGIAVLLCMHPVLSRMWFDKDVA